METLPINDRAQNAWNKKAEMAYWKDGKTRDAERVKKRQKDPGVVVVVTEIWINKGETERTIATAQDQAISRNCFKNKIEITKLTVNSGYVNNMKKLPAT